MTYELKGGQEWRYGVLHGWTGRRCQACHGTGERTPTGDELDDHVRSCPACGGTGDEWGRMPSQPRLTRRELITIELQKPEHRGKYVIDVWKPFKEHCEFHCMWPYFQSTARVLFGQGIRIPERTQP